jgi:hypothetical protein
MYTPRQHQPKDILRLGQIFPTFFTYIDVIFVTLHRIKTNQFIRLPPPRFYRSSVYMKIWNSLEYFSRLIQFNVILLHRQTPVATPMAAGDAFVFLFILVVVKLHPTVQLKLNVKP